METARSRHPTFYPSTLAPDGLAFGTWTIGADLAAFIGGGAVGDTESEPLRREVIALDSVGARNKTGLAYAQFVWDLLMVGQWAVFDWFEHAGRRYFVLAHDRGARPLSERARLIAKRHAIGEISKSVALAMGVSASTVCTYLVGSLVKCQLRSRGELVSFHDALFGGGSDLLRVTNARTEDRAFVVVSRALARGEEELTSAEKDVAKLVANGLTNRAIASQRRTSVRTVDHQLAALMRKLGAPSRHHVAARALRGLQSET